MAEEKKRGFHALEKRIHEMEEQDRTQDQRKASEGKEPRPQEKKEPPRK
jgi:hypothetical protein